MDKAPLVSVMIPNYNHSKYLPDCLESVIKQTYSNIETVVLDNQSKDDSVAVAARYAGQNIRVCRNAYNTLNQSYRTLSEKLTSGKYMILLCADDYIHPEFIARAVEIMEAYPNVGYVHGERDFVTEDGRIIELDPFYNCSFTAPGSSDTPVYMVTTVAHPSQGIFRRSAFQQIRGYDKVIDHLNADKLLWFYLSQVSDYAYIRDKMCRIRIGEQSETVFTQENFMHPIFNYLTIKELISYGKEHNLEAVVRREDEALNRTAVDLFESIKRMIVVGSWERAEAYLKFCRVICREIVRNPDYVMLARMVQKKRADIQWLNQKKESANRKKRSYSPPSGYIEL